MCQFLLQYVLLIFIDSENVPLILASSSRDRLIRMYNLSNPDSIRTLDDHSAAITSFHFAEGGKALISGASGNLPTECDRQVDYL